MERVSMPETLGRFRILEPLGGDFIGARYLAFDPQINRQVVLRTLAPSSEDAEGLVREHFLQEARTAARLSHPNIIKVFGIHTEEPQPFVVLENLDGPSLEELLAGSGPLTVDRTVRLIGQVADALEYAHREGVIHRDVRPGAIVVLPGDQPVLTGFVMAKMVDLVSAVTRQGMTVGTPGYSSPELVTGGNTDLRGDIFSLGAVIYEMITGRQAFVGKNMAETLYRIAHAEPDPPSSLVPGLDERHDRLLLRTLDKSPQQRQQSMGELRAELEAWLTTEPASTDPLADTDEITAEYCPVGGDDTSQLPVEDPGQTVAAEMPDPEPEPVPEPEPDPRGVPVPAAVAKGPVPRGSSGKLITVVAAAAAVVLVSLLAAWQFGWFGGSEETAGERGGNLVNPLEEVADADPSETGLPSAVESAPVQGDTGGAVDQETVQTVDESETIAETPAEESAEQSIDSSGAETSEAKVEPPKETVAVPPPTGVLEVASLPWARVTLDGKARGETPLRIDGLAEGEHRLSLTGADGLQWSGVVTVRGNRSTYHFHNFRIDG